MNLDFLKKKPGGQSTGPIAAGSKSSSNVQQAGTAAVGKPSGQAVSGKSNVRAVIDQGKQLKESVDSKVDVEEVDYAALYLGKLLYSSITASLETLCKLINWMAAAEDTKKIFRISIIVIVIITLPLMLLNLLSGNISGISYPIGGILAWYYIWVTINNSTASDLDRVMQEIVQGTDDLELVLAYEGHEQIGLGQEEKRFINDVEVVDDDTYI